MKIAFFGTPQFAATSLEALIKEQDIEVTIVFTQPDKKVGRKQILTASPVKQLALNYNIEVRQPENKAQLEEQCQDLEVDFFVVIAYGMIMSQRILDIPKIAPINVHASLLPKYRGASPIQAALLNGDKKTGVAFMKMEQKLDAGPVYKIEELIIEPKDTSETLFSKLEKLSAEKLPKALKEIQKGLEAEAQDESKATHCGKIKKEDGKIDWAKPAQEIINQIRAYTPWPSSYTEFEGKKLKIIEAKIGSETNQTPGVLTISEKTIQYSSGDNLIIPTRVQLEGKTAMDIETFLNGITNAKKTSTKS